MGLVVAGASCDWKNSQDGPGAVVAPMATLPSVQVGVVLALREECTKDDNAISRGLVRLTMRFFVSPLVLSWAGRMPTVRCPLVRTMSLLAFELFISVLPSSDDFVVFGGVMPR